MEAGGKEENDIKKVATDMTYTNELMMFGS